MTARAALGLVLVVALGCGGDDPPRLDREAMLDPESCRDCHPKHFDEWQSSMHAYAGDDPVFLAMNARGQRETGGLLGEFCVSCHAPMALREGLTSDGLNLAELPQQYKGVTCFFCHTTDEVRDDHNNPLVLADDLVMRGGFGDAIENGAHDAAYSPLHDRNNPASSSLCGSCHDIVTPAGVHLERTFAEYRDSVFPGLPAPAMTCSRCHMVGVDDDVVADFDGVPLRERKEHGFPGVDTAITEWPGKDLQLAGIARDFSALLLPRVCHNPAGNQIEVRLTNVGAAHMWPSGATQDRRAWVELKASSGGAEIYRSGVVPAGGAVTELADPDLWLLRDKAFDADGEEAHMFWDVATTESRLLPPAVTFDPDDPRFDHSVLHVYPLGALPAPETIELRFLIQAIGRDVLDDLIASGDLAASFRDAFPTLEVGTFTWTLAAAGGDRCLP